MIEFQSAHPVRGATITPSMFTLVSAYFKPRAPCGARQTRIEFASDNIKFQTTRPVWGATTITVAGAVVYDKFQSTRPVWGATCVTCWRTTAVTYFNPRAPCGARHRQPRQPEQHGEFQSTRPVWGATTRRMSDGTETDISIHAPRVGRDRKAQKSRRKHYISIHAPRVGRDNFTGDGVDRILISIHAPRVGRDLPAAYNHLHQLLISIHAPRVGRDVIDGTGLCAARIFQSTRPVWGATFFALFGLFGAAYFNPRAPCGARPCACRSCPRQLRDFNPRAPCGARLCCFCCRCKS